MTNSRQDEDQYLKSPPSPASSIESSSNIGVDDGRRNLLAATSRNTPELTGSQAKRSVRFEDENESAGSSGTENGNTGFSGSDDARWTYDEDFLNSSDDEDDFAHSGEGGTAPLLTNIAAPSVVIAGMDIDDLEDPSSRSGMKMAFMNMANSIIGAGIIGQPYAFKQAGLATGVILLVVLTILVDWTINLIVINSKLSGANSFQSTIAQWAFAFGGMIAFCIIIGDTIPHVLGAIFPALRDMPVLWLLTNRRAVIALCVIGISYPLSLYRDIAKVGDSEYLLYPFSKNLTESGEYSQPRQLAKASALALVSMLVIILTVITQGFFVAKELKGSLTGPLLTINSGVFQAIGVISFDHNSLLIYGSLRKPTLDRFARVTHYSTGISMVACMAMAFAGFLTFGDKTMGNVLNNFPSSNLIVNIARFCFGLNMLTTLPLEAFVCREVMLNYWYPGAPFDLRRHVIFTTSLFPPPQFFRIASSTLSFKYDPSRVAAMGQTLSEPVVEKISEHGEDDRLYFGLSTMQGWRISMEDAHAAVLDLQPDDKTENTTLENRVSFFGVYDGHGGDGVALFSGQNVHKIIAKQTDFSTGNYEKAMKDGFLASDRAILQDPKYNDEISGCTASTAIITNEKIFVANAGDSRTVLGVKGRAKPLSFDHKPQNEGEKARITAAGGFVDFGRVNGNLALSRAIGDFEFKKSADLPPEQQIVTSFPDVVIHDLSDDDEFMVIACDGIWDCQSSQAVVEFVRRGIVEKQELQKICENMMHTCLAPSSENGGVGCDNMTMVIVAFLRGKTKEDWYEMVAKRVADGDGPCAPPEYGKSLFIQAAQPKPHGVRPSVYDANFEEEEDGTIKTYHITTNAREGGRIIMLGDGTEVLTDSDDTDMFDYDEEEKDTEALDKDASTHIKNKADPTNSSDSDQVVDKSSSSKDAKTTGIDTSEPTLEEVSK
ncbi:hypothetical protein H072_10877 [Dactylellina haptotyla CBS 200.50]|uniref:Protein phosphatase 2C homolog 2 n=1 Tax=Dactylellina haptotyla (strain CBS 200.50) TaxID=1284197 RepID=S7ZZ58_DACHA|nr:hypothetical protein H072_10877 [Dactylellina haptotyla CBS 200.50]